MTDTILTVTLVVALATAVISRRWCIAIIGFCLPLTRWLPGTSIAGLNLTNLLFLAVLAHTVLSKKNPASKDIRDPVTIPALIVVGFIFISVLRVQFSDDVPQLFILAGGRYTNIQKLKDIVFLFVLYFCSRRLLRDSDTVRATIIGVMSGYTLQTLLASAAFLAGADYDHRAQGVLGESNELGLFLATYVMLPVAVLMDSTRRLFTVAVPVVAAALAGILGTLSRGALLAGGGAVTVMAFTRRTFWIVLIAGALATSPQWLPQNVLDRFTESKARDRWGLSSVPGFDSAQGLDVTREARFHIWRAGMRMVIDKPVFGIGLGLFPYRVQEYGSSRFDVGPHNEYLWLGAQCGIPAALAHLALLLGLGRVALRLALQRDDTLGSTFGLGMLGMVTSLLIGGMFLAGFYSNAFAGPFLILSAIGVNVYSGSIRRHSAS